MKGVACLFSRQMIFCESHINNDIKPRMFDPRPCSMYYIKCTICNNSPTKCFGRLYQCAKCGLIGSRCCYIEPLIFTYDIQKNKEREEKQNEILVSQDNNDPTNDSYDTYERNYKDGQTQEAETNTSKAVKADTSTSKAVTSTSKAVTNSNLFYQNFTPRFKLSLLC
jgi:hypothetical protein